MNAMTRRAAACLLLLAWTSASVASAADAVDGTFRFYGYAYDLASNRYLYTTSWVDSVYALTSPPVPSNVPPK